MSENNENVFIDDTCLIEDDYYKSVKNSIECAFCHKILNEPMMCLSCQDAFCKECTKLLKQDNHSCENPTYIKNKNANRLLAKVKYLCKNCLCEIKKEDIENHLKEKCIKNENPTKLINIIYRKKSLRKLKDEEIKELKQQNKEINHISCKIILLIILFLF